MSEISAPFFKHESFGAVDGPGVRLVIFLQGCPLRCIYCHNPESWEINKKVKTITPSEIINLYNKNKTFYANGGITISGGEPLIHLDFCLELAKICKEKNISLVLDTSGVGFNKNNIEKYRQLAHLVDIWLIDIKHINPTKHKMITGVDNQNEIDLINFLEKEKGHYWVRQVLVPGYTDDPDDLRQLGKFLKGLKCMLKFELLPYHNMAIPKYENLKIKYGLKDLQPPSKDAIKKAMQYIKEGMSK